MKISTKYMTINYTEKDREYMKYLLDYLQRNEIIIVNFFKTFLKSIFNGLHIFFVLICLSIFNNILSFKYKI